MTGEERVTYRSVLRNREFAAILFSQGLSTAGNQLARIAVAVLVFAQTESGLLASGTYAVSYLTYLVGGPFLSVLSDRYPRLTVMVVCDLLRVPLVLLLCMDDLPLWALFAILITLGLLAPPFDSARSAIQPEILTGEAYIAGNAIINIVLQLGEVLGFVVGGALVAELSVRGALIVDAATFLVSAGALLAFLMHRPAALEGKARRSVLRDAAEGLVFVRRSAVLTRYLAFSVIGSAALVTPEGLAVPVAHEIGGGAFAAGVLTATVSMGFVVASLMVVRVPVARRSRLLFPLALLALIPMLFTPLTQQLGVIVVLWTVAGLGACLNLIASAGYIQECPSELRSRAYGLAGTLVFTTQGASLVLAGALADATSARMANAIVACAMLLLLLSLRGPLSTSKPAQTGQTAPSATAKPQGNSQLLRGSTG